MTDSARPVLKACDHLRLRSVSASGAIPRSLRDRLLDFLSLAVVAPEGSGSTGCVGLYDLVTLVADGSEKQTIELTIVLPGEQNFRKARIAAVSEQALALLGRRCGDAVTWAEPPRTRRMRIAAVTEPGGSERSVTERSDC